MPIHADLTILVTDWEIADSCHDAVVVLTKGRPCKTAELHQVENTVVLSRQPVQAEGFDNAWALMKVPRLNSLTGTWCWTREWRTSYDETLVPRQLQATS